jgi:hypothetical protein
MTISNLAFMLLPTISDNIPFYFYNVFECKYLGNGDIILLFVVMQMQSHLWHIVNVGIIGMAF